MKMKILAIGHGKLNTNLFHKSEIPKVEVKPEPSALDFQDLLDTEIARLKEENRYGLGCTRMFTGKK